MKNEEIIGLFGNVLIGITCPFLFLASDDPIKLFKKEKVDEGNTIISRNSIN